MTRSSPSLQSTTTYYTTVDAEEYELDTSHRQSDDTVIDESLCDDDAELEQSSSDQESLTNNDIRYEDSFIPISVPPNHEQPNARPVILNPGVLIFILIFNCLCTLGIIILEVKTAMDGGFHTTDTNIQHIARFLPTILGTITTLAYNSMVATLIRIMPYMDMAASDGIEPNGSNSIGYPFFPATILHLRFLPVNNRHLLRSITIGAGIWISGITAFKSGLLKAKNVDSNGFILATNPQVARVLIAIYLADIFVTLGVLTVVRKCQTGLKWDPVTIVDQVALFRGSNVLDDFRTLEFDKSRSESALSGKSYRIGYWEKGVERKLHYGIGRTIHGGKKTMQRMTTQDVLISCSRHAADSQPTGDTRIVHLPFCTCPQPYAITDRHPHSIFSFIDIFSLCGWIILIVASICLVIYILIRFRNGTFSLNNTWYLFIPSLSDAPGTIISNTTSVNITSSDPFSDIGPFALDSGHDLILYITVFRTLPVYLSSVFAIGFINIIDASHRFTEPFTNMFNKHATASETLLLNYFLGIPGVVTFNALKSSHWKVAWFSFLNLISPSFPVLVGGLFTITNTGSKIVFTFNPRTVWFILLFLVVYLVSLPFAWPGRDRRLPSRCNSIADLLVLFYASALLSDENLDIMKDLDITEDTKPEYLGARMLIRESKNERFSVGLFTGRDGEKNFGVDVAVRKNETGDDVEHVKCVRTIQDLGLEHS